MLKHIFWRITEILKYLWRITDCSRLYATGVTLIQNVVLRRIGKSGDYRSRDKDGGHTIRSAIVENPLLYANVTTLSFIEPELLPIEVFHCGNREFRVFLRKIVEIIIFCSHPKRNVAVAETHFLTHYLLFYGVCYLSHTHSKCCFTPMGWRGHLRSRVTLFDLQWSKNHAMRKLHDSIFYRTGEIADWSFTWRE